MPYEPWIGVCSQLVEHAPEELLGGMSRAHRRRAVPPRAQPRTGASRSCPAPQSSDPETERYLLFNAVAGLLEEVAETVPLCVVLDDLHWADAQSLALLKHLLRSTEQGALQVIVTYRDSDLGKDHPLTAVLADLRSLQGVQRIALHGLGADEVAEIMTRRRRATSSTRTGSSWPARSLPRPTATRSSSGRSCGDCRSPARSYSMRPPVAGASIARPGSRCPRACAR